MKKEQKNNKALLSQETKKSFTRIILKSFVWLLVIAFVSTIGVMWDDLGGGFPVVITSSKEDITLSPRDFYMLEYGRLEKQIREQNSNLDPRALNRYVQYASLTNTETVLAHMRFYEDIKLAPSPKRFQEIQSNTGLTSNLIYYQYGENYYNGPIGVLTPIGMPTVSDMYTVNDLQNLKIAVELAVLNKTNFLMAKITDEEKSNYYDQNFKKWLRFVAVQEFKVENRGQAREVIKVLKENGLDKAIPLLKANQELKVQITTNKVLSADANTYNYFIEILNTYETNRDQPLIITDPIYYQGDYHIAVITEITSYPYLNPEVQQMVTIDYIFENYTSLEKQFGEEWNTAIQTFTDQTVQNISYSQMVADLTGLVHHTTQPFTMLNTIVTNVLGATVNLPILRDKGIISVILNTPIAESSTVSPITQAEDVYVAVRPLDRQFTPTDTSRVNVFEDQNLYQQVYTYKFTLLRDAMSSLFVKDRFKIQSFPEELTNLDLVY